MTDTAVPPRKRLFIRTWGCQMNVYDSGRMADVLAPLGYGPAETPEEADMVILNTCHIREKASEKVFSDLGRLRVMKEAKAEAGQKMVLAVAGCVAQAEGKEITTRAPWVDIVLGPQTYHRLPEMVARAARAAGAQIDTDFPVEQKFDHLPDSTAPSGPTAFLTIQEGCDKFCSFCVVPYTRGAEFSRPVAAIMAEARRLVAGGAREIALLGQNVNAWHGEAPDGSTWDLTRLLYALAELPDLPRIRYTTSHPRDMDAGLIRAHGEIPQLMPFLHLPVQSGSDRVLAAMNRGHKADLFYRIADELRAARPDMALSSDFIVGHPGETAEDHAATMALVEKVGFALAYSFKYSQRPGTPAAGQPFQVAEDVKDARLQELQALLRQQQDAFNEDCVGRECEVLFTNPGRHAGQVMGRTPWLQPLHAIGPSSLIGTTARVRIVERFPNSLSAILLDQKELALA
ncbi:tRNA (N6-isopentenyl adenosine(37)-C2)-methylthiotransferase MiaB [Roseomonas marmotae]|uniref:tRNA-2-methylthio-N(6)-dimethylallyladenosine synthase n=1 Tax=Roseomonas marmotae TaxID=2768161 RepID=A0ABS3K8C9_9PROT|nr:tRNA (N6-isopentenyl adenosine(37)-C2)-methylthiotransferase MiaB [Roseomonas marmotae]MBO1073262.1 tRNA (N6-isopentenyl adenosine(37)-C2)-methylthiotransferase MiaB [Roseomonas marmotae]QTI79114.1 tRNA (N6-isopentenyl adenosine(37)-C2)-methylthiotransferase MiaB [Roseomonas marmotae]